MRISVQLRAGDDPGGRVPANAGKRTVYADASAQDRTIFFDDLMPVGETHTVRPIADGIRTILFRGRRDQHEVGRLGTDLDQEGRARSAGLAQKTRRWNRRDR